MNPLTKWIAKRQPAPNRAFALDEDTAALDSGRLESTEDYSAVFTVTSIGPDGSYVDRDGDVLLPEAVDISEWVAAGAPLLAFHNANSVPIASARNPISKKIDWWPEKTRIRARFHFFKDDPDSMKVFNACKHGVGATSVAFIPRVAEERPRTAKETRSPFAQSNLVYSDVALTEVSYVTTPANALAVLEGTSPGFHKRGQDYVRKGWGICGNVPKPKSRVAGPRVSALLQEAQDQVRLERICQQQVARRELTAAWEGVKKIARDYGVLPREEPEEEKFETSGPTPDAIGESHLIDQGAVPAEGEEHRLDEKATDELATALANVKASGLLSDEEFAQLEAMCQRKMGEGAGASGGYAVPLSKDFNQADLMPASGLPEDADDAPDPDTAEILARYQDAPEPSLQRIMSEALRTQRGDTSASDEMIEEVLSHYRTNLSTLGNAVEPDAATRADSGHGLGVGRRTDMRGRESSFADRGR